MRTTSQRILEITSRPEGASTRQIVEEIWPEFFRGPKEFDTARKCSRFKTPGERCTRPAMRGMNLCDSHYMQHLLSKARNALVIHQGHGRVSQNGYSYGSYNRSRSISWKITPDGQAWLRLNDPDKQAHRKAVIESAAEDKASQKENCQRLLEEAQREYGPGTVPSIRREVSRLLRAEGCTLQSIANIFGVTREQIRIDCRGLKESHKLSVEERAGLFADE